VFLLSKAAISWCTKLQATVATSTAEAEYMALAATTAEAVYLRELLRDVDLLGRYDPSTLIPRIPYPPTVIYEDNQACILLSAHPTFHARTKHINIRYHFTRERIQMKEIEVKFLRSEHMAADLLTKALPTHSHLRHTTTILGNRILEVDYD
jgi:hypothetical protein